MAIVSIYLPPPFRFQLLYEILAKVAPFLPIPIVFAGDFNAILNPELDSSNPNRTPGQELVGWAEAASLQEVWRWKNPNVRGYSCVSYTHNSSSRIDMAFANDLFLGLVSEAGYLPGGVSDHSPLSLTLTFPTPFQRRGWRLSPGWLGEEGVASRVSPLVGEYWAHNEGSAEAAVVWDAFKAYLRGVYISHIKVSRREFAAAREDLQRVEEECARAYATSPGEASLGALRVARRALQVHLRTLTGCSLREAAEARFEQGDKNGKWLALLVADHHPLTNIPCILTSVGERVTDPVTIMEEFRQYYSALYAPVAPYDGDVLRSLLEGLGLPCLGQLDRESLEVEISVPEIERAIGSFPAGKAPGPDGFPAEWYRYYLPQVASRLQGLYSSCLARGRLPDSLYEANVVLIPKPGKDPLFCSSYRPIALLNMDLKILTKILAMRLGGVISSLVNIDQTGFIPGKSTDTNLRRVFTHLQLTHTTVGSRALVSLDIEKAFDSVDWGYMGTVLQFMGFGPNFCRWITVLYNEPTASLKIGSALSDSFPVGRGTRQGCPLSPGLFALMMEPLAVALRTSTGLEGFRVGSIEERLALYADDLILFLADAGPSLREALRILDQFSVFSGLKVNWAKSHILPLDDGTMSSADGSVPLQWVTQITYLGVKISARVGDYHSLNLTPALAQVRRRLLAWKNLPISMIGKVNLLKMKIFPVLLYFLRNSPVWVPASFFRGVTGMFRDFVWVSQVPRLRMSILQAPWTGGGLALPDMKKYYLAGQMVVVHRWLVEEDSDSAVVLEAASLGSYEALSSLVYRGCGAPYDLTLSMRATLKAWKQVSSALGGGELTVSPHAPLWRNPNLAHFRTIPDCHVWARKGIKKLEDILTDGNITCFEDLCIKFKLPGSFLFRYLQLCHAFRAQFVPTPGRFGASSLECMLRTQGLRKPLSTVYSTLFPDRHSPLSSCGAQWHREVQDLDEEEWREAWDYPFTHLISARDRLIQYKLLHRVYYTPARLARIYSSSSAICWRCTFSPAGFSHVFWECPVIQRYWVEIAGFISRFLMLDIQPEMGLCLLGLTERVTSTHATGTLLGILLFYARKLIVLHWKKPDPPTLENWRGLIESVIPLYKAAYIHRACPQKFHKVWGRWLDAFSAELH